MSDPDEMGPTPPWRAPGWEHNIYEHMEAIRSHVQFWIGEPTIHKLVLYLIGYEGALWVHSIEEPDCPPLKLFMGWLEKTRPIPPNRGLDDELLHEAQGDNELALGNFFNLFAEFGRFRVVLGEFVDIPRGHAPTTCVVRMQPVPTRIQFDYLQPGKWCFLKEWTADRVRYWNYLYDDGRAAKTSVESQFGITPDMWSPAATLRERDG